MTKPEHVRRHHSAERSAGGSRVLNTTKCEHEQLTAKLAAIARSFATGTGSQSDATTRTVVLAMTPRTPDATNAPYARHRSWRPDSAAKVMKQFITYEPDTATSQASTLAGISGSL